MQFANVIGNSELKQQLAQMVRGGRLSHAILLCEDGQWGAMAVAVALAQLLNCTGPHEDDSCGTCDSCHKYGKLIHPDLHFVFPTASAKGLSESEKKAPVSDYFMNQWRELLLADPYFSEQELYDALGIENKSAGISVHESKRIFEKLSLRAFEGEYKTLIIYLPEKMNAEAANKLLKLLEEPPVGTVFILVSHASENLLSTIRSRCQRINLRPLSHEEEAQAGIARTIDPEYHELTTTLLKACLAKDLLATFPVWEAVAEMGREKQREWVSYTEDFLRKMMLTADGMAQIACPLPEERAVIEDLCGKVKPTFYEKGFKALESTLTGIAANVNPKLLYCNLCNTLLLAM